MHKPTVDIEDCFLLGDRLYGFPLNYPDNHQGFPGAVSGSKYVVTSPIISRDGNHVETERTIYNVINWMDEDEN